MEKQPELFNNTNNKLLNNTKLINKRRNTQLLQTNAIDQLTETNSEKVFYGHRLQSLRTLAMSSQKSTSLLNRGLSKEFKESLDEMESKELNKENGDKNKEEHVDHKSIIENLNKVKLNELNKNLNCDKASQAASMKNQSKSSKFTLKGNEQNRIRRSGQDIDELIKKGKGKFLFSIIFCSFFRITN